MNPALGPFAIAAILLVVAGALKALRPHDTARAIELMGLPAGEATVRFGGAVELGLGLAALAAVDAIIATLVAVSYAAFGAFVALALARHLPIASCGCLGRVDTPPSRVHLGVSLGACIAAIGMTIDAATSPADVAAEHGLESAAFVLLVAVGVIAAFAAMTLRPRVATSTTGT